MMSSTGSAAKAPALQPNSPGRCSLPGLACVELRYSSTRSPPNTRPTAWSSVQAGASSSAATRPSAGCAARAAAAAAGASPTAAAAAAAAAGTAAGGSQAACRRQCRCVSATCSGLCDMHDAEGAAGEPARLWESAWAAVAAGSCASAADAMLLRRENANLFFWWPSSPLECLLRPAASRWRTQTSCRPDLCFKPLGSHVAPHSSPAALRAAARRGSRLAWRLPRLRAPADCSQRFR